jgi:hypothetical protein
VGSGGRITIHTQLIEAIPNSTMPSLAEQGPLGPPPTLSDDDCTVRQESGGDQ